jgi:hypothetical protein
LLDDDGVNAQAALETDFIKSPQVGRVGYGNRQAVSSFVQRNDLVRCNQLPINGVLRDVALVQRVEIK